jgi:hypothetical protein
MIIGKLADYNTCYEAPGKALFPTFFPLIAYMHNLSWETMGNQNDGAETTRGWHWQVVANGFPGFPREGVPISHDLKWD